MPQPSPPDFLLEEYGNVSIASRATNRGLYERVRSPTQRGELTMLLSLHAELQHEARVRVAIWSSSASTVVPLLLHALSYSRISSSPSNAVYGTLMHFGPPLFRRLQTWTALFPPACHRVEPEPQHTISKKWMYLLGHP